MRYKNLAKRKFSVLDYGALPGAPALQTPALQAAIDACFLAGGGEVTVPAGVFRTGGLRLRSHVTLHLLTGAVLEGSRDPEDYFILEQDTVEPVPKRLISHGGCFDDPPVGRDIYGRRWLNALIRAYQAEDIAIIGEKGSLIDGKNCYDELGEEHYRGPHGITFICCRHVVLRGFTVQHASNWAENIWKSQDILCENLTNLAGHDGVHITTCDDVIIRGCRFYTGDDCVAGFDNRNVLVEDCLLNTACSAFRFGGTNVLITRCRILAPALHPFRGFLSTEEKRAGINAVDAKPENQRSNMLSVFTYFADYSSRVRSLPGNITLRDCTVDGADRFLHYNFSGNEIWQNNRPLSDIVFEHITAKNVSMPLTGYGDPALPFTLRFSDVRIRFRPGAEPVDFMHLAHFKRLIFEQVTVSGRQCNGLVKSWSAPGKVVCRDLRINGKPMDAAALVVPAGEPFRCQPI